MRTSSMLIRASARRPCDKYQRYLNSQLIPARIIFAVPSWRVRNSTGSRQRRGSRFIVMRMGDTPANARVRSGSLACRRDQCSRQATRTKQPFVLGLDRCIAFAGSVAEALQIGDLDVSPTVADEIGLL
jgi:hypothetical protein